MQVVQVYQAVYVELYPVTNGQTRCAQVLMANRGWCQIQIRQGSCHCAREACSTNRNRRPIDPGKLTGSTLRWCTRPFDDTFVICSPNLAHHRPRAYLLYTGKISLSQSIAPALGRPFQCISSDGVCDEVELRGHRSACVVSGLGLAAQALRKTCLKTAPSWMKLLPSAISVFVKKWWKRIWTLSVLPILPCIK